MKRIAIVLLAAVMMCAAPSLSAQQASVPVGHIDMEALLQAMPDLEKVKTELETLQKELESTLETLQVEYNQKLDEYQTKKSTWSDLVIATKEQDLVQLGDRIQAFQNQAQTNLSTKQAELMQPVQDKMVKAIAEVAAEKGLLYVFHDATAIYVAPNAIDLMADVKKKLGIN